MPGLHHQQGAGEAVATNKGTCVPNAKAVSWGVEAGPWDAPLKLVSDLGHAVRLGICSMVLHDDIWWF